MCRNVCGLHPRRSSVLDWKTIAAGTIVCLILAGAENGLADEATKYSWEAGPELSYYVYEEPHFAELSGFRMGIAGAFTYHDTLMLRAEGRYSYGSLSYTSPESGTMGNVPDYLAEFRGLGGYDCSLSSGMVLTPYIGFAYRYLNDDSAGKFTSTGAAGYDRESNYFYSPVGASIKLPAKNGWSVEALAEYDLFWGGKQVTHLGDALPGAPELDNRQKQGYGLRGALSFAKKISNVEYVAGPFIRYWNIGESEHAIFSDPSGLLCGSTLCEGYEPANHTTEFGISVQARF